MTEENTVFLPKFYKGGNEKYVGKPMVSWSQIETWNDKAGFNTGLKGLQEYILKYFTGVEFTDMGWGTFGTEVEGYVCEREYQDKFTEDEKEVLNTVKPLGVFQQEILVDFGDFVTLGFIDDAKADFKKIRDYKTKSESSKKDLHDPKKHQLNIYGLWVQQEFGFIPEAEYLIIERLGGKECMSGGGREALSVGKQIWQEPYELTADKLEKTKSLVRKTVEEISSFHRTYVKVFGSLK